MIYMYASRAASTFLVGICSAYLSSIEEDSDESEELYARTLSVAPFSVQTAVSAIDVLEKILTATGSNSSS
jgi:hypothetical protein